jgi:DNA-directed RNA polymerase specialized sigma24 family protein
MPFAWGLVGKKPGPRLRRWSFGALRSPYYHHAPFCRTTVIAPAYLCDTGLKKSSPGHLELYYVNRSAVRMPEQTATNRPEPRWFATTHWSVVLAAQNAKDEKADEALERLCQTYWYPLYAFLRRSGHGSADAEDLTQGFFAYLLEVQLLKKANRQMRRFRSFLLGSFQLWLSNQAQRQRAVKRGNGRSPISLDSLTAEQRYALEPRTEETPASSFERAWAETLVGGALRLLEQELAVAGQQARLQALRPVLLGESAGANYAQIGRALGLDETAVKVAVHRLRKRFGQLLRASVSQTVKETGDVEAELRHLLRVLGR